MATGRLTNDAVGCVVDKSPSLYRSLSLSLLCNPHDSCRAKRGWFHAHVLHQTHSHITRKACFQIPKPRVWHSRVQMCANLFSVSFPFVFCGFNNSTMFFFVTFSKSSISWSTKKEFKSLEILCLIIGTASDN